MYTSNKCNDTTIFGVGAYLPITGNTQGYNINYIIPTLFTKGTLLLNKSTRHQKFLRSNTASSIIISLTTKKI